MGFSHPTSFLFLKELRQIRSDRRFSVLIGLTLLVTFIAAIEGWHRTSEIQELNEEVIDIERETWLNQGSANPHDAAHFGRYALRPTSALEAFDPGVFDYGGSTVWMEAHFQNPPSLRRAENQLSLYPIGFLTPAWIISMFVPLIIGVLLHGSIVGEKERGTLKKLQSFNMKASQLLFSKTAAALVVSGLVVGVLVGLACLPNVLHQQIAIEWMRLVCLLVAYFLAMVTLAISAIFISCVCKKSKQAFWGIVCGWILMAFAVPLFANQVAQDLYPTPRDRDFAAQIQSQAQAPFWLGAAQFEEVALYEAEVLTRHRVTERSNLPLNRDALVLQAHERFANRVYDELYGKLYTAHRQQDYVMRVASLFSPVLAIQRISKGLSGTDLNSQINFAQDAEQHRRTIIRRLNEDMMYHAGNHSFHYEADYKLWEQIEDFKAQSTPVPTVLSSYSFELIVLMVWGLTGLALTWFSLRRLLRPQSS